jgi:hypothetical protein
VNRFVKKHFVGRGAWLLCSVLVGCTTTHSPRDVPATHRQDRSAANTTTPGGAEALTSAKLPGSIPGAEVPPASDASGAGKAEGSGDPLGGARIDPDGNDDPEDAGTGTMPLQGHFEKVGRPPISLRQICDLTPLRDALYAAHALSPLGGDGATISRYRPRDKRPFTVAFDWNRPGEPTKGGGAGQGFLRVRAIGGRLFVPDADPPYNGFGLLDWGTEGYVFVSRSDGSFAYAMRPHFRPPGRPTQEDKPGAIVLPRAYHDFDVIRFRGHVIASTGSVPPKERAWYGPSPGALHVASADWSRATYQVAYPVPDPGGVWRLTYLVRFRDRLYAGIQDYDGRSPHDYVVVEPPSGVTEIAQEQLRAVRVTEGGAAQTVRWYTDRNRLYWIAWGHDGVRLRVTDDGDRWTTIPLPGGIGAPTDVVRFRDALVVLTEQGLFKLSDAGAITPVVRITDKKSPFELRDMLCAAPLAVFDNELYAGGQRDGSLYRLVSE